MILFEHAERSWGLWKEYVVGSVLRLPCLVAAVSFFFNIALKRGLYVGNEAAKIPTQSSMVEVMPEGILSPGKELSIRHED